MPTIVCGYDGSRTARSAVEQAVRRAVDGHLVVVHAYHVPEKHIAAPSYDLAVARAREFADGVVQRLMREIPSLQDASWEHVVVEGRPAEALARVARERGADEIVIGTRGVGRVGALLGSVAHDVLRLADRPVLVIPERMTAQEPAAEAAATSA